MMEENWYAKMLESISNLSDKEKQQLKEKYEKAKMLCEARHCAFLLRYDRAFKREDNFERYGNGEYHVYMWLHADGTPFYVGMGKGDRWKNASARNERFFEETKKLDTWVCKLIDGLTQQEAREAEFCLSHYLTYNGYKLANHDKSFYRCQEDRRVEKFVRLMKKTHNAITVEQAKTKMTPCKMPCEPKLIWEQYKLNYGIPV